MKKEDMGIGTIPVMEYLLEYKVKFKKLHEDAVIPSYAKPFDSGMDLVAVEGGFIVQEEVTPIHTGLAVELPDPTETYPYTLEMQIRPRSGLAAKWGITVVNTPGTIDNQYRGELIVLLTMLKDCRTDEDKAISEYLRTGRVVLKGDRIAQAVIVPVLSSNVIKIEEVENLNNTERGTGGFGSTGK